MHEVFIGVGSNVNREANIIAGVRSLREAFGELRCSSVWDNPAEGFEGDDFLNLVVAFNTKLDVHAVYRTLHDIEDGFGRTRDAGTKMVSRTLDLDLLLYGDEVIDEGRIQVPRDEITEYAFVLAPIAELAPDRVHPVNGKTYAELWREFAGNRDALTRVVVNL